MKKKLIFPSILYFLISVPIISCSSAKSGFENAVETDHNSTVFPIKSPQPGYLSPNLLCERLVEIREIPYYPGEPSEDPIYNGLMKAGESAIPCLIEKIADTTRIDDPRIAPKFQDFKVGDAAVWILLYISKMKWQPDSMFPPEYAKRWKAEGVFAYFAYVEKPGNRKQMQLWWKNWMKDNLRN